MFLYVYQPSHAIKDLIATSVNMSAATDDDTLDNHIYSLKLVSTHGVFDKYVVEGLQIPTTGVRIYNIVSLYRAWDEAIDEGTGNDNTISEVVYSVSKKWTALTTNSNVYYVEESIETIEVTGKYAGYGRYKDHPIFGGDDLDSFFVGFKTEKKIENLLSAKVYAEALKTVSTWRLYGFGITVGQGTKTSVVDQNEFIVNRGEEDSFVSYGPFGIEYKDYSWDQIQTVDEFYSQKGLTFNTPIEEAKDSMDWVLRFFNAPHRIKEKSFVGYGKKTETTYYVKDVSILQLTFKENDTVHVVGIVDNIQSGSKDPFFETKTNDWIAELVAWVFRIIFIVLGVVLILNFAPWILTFLGNLFVLLLKALLWMISLPFKLLNKFFSWIKRKRREKQENED